MTHPYTSSSSATELPPFITLLGPVAVHNPRGEIEADHREGQLTRIAAWLVLNPGGTPQEMERDLWVAGRRSNTRNTAISKLRKWLGNGPDGRPYLPRHEHNHGYALHPSIRCDWHLYINLIVGGLNRTPAADLMTALDLVQGAPFTSTTGDYSWAEPTREKMVAVIRDTAHMAALSALRTRQLDHARRAIAKGYLADAEDEVLARDELLTEAAAGNRRGVQRIADRLLADHGHTLQPATLALLRRVRPAPGPTVSCGASRVRAWGALLHRRHRPWLTHADQRHQRGGHCRIAAAMAGRPRRHAASPSRSNASPRAPARDRSTIQFQGGAAPGHRAAAKAGLREMRPHLWSNFTQPLRSGSPSGPGTVGGQLVEDVMGDVAGAVPAFARPRHLRSTAWS